MANEDVLHTLVHSLDKDEIKFFRTNIPPGYTRRPKPVMAFFETLLAQDEYDKASLEKKFKGLRKLRSQLKDYLLKNMRLKRDLQSEKAQVAAHLSDYEFLYGKGLYETSMKSLLKAKKLAGEYQFNGLLIDIVNIEKHRLLEMRKHDLVETMEEKNLEVSKCLASYSREMEAASEYHEVLSLFRKGGKAIHEIKAIVGSGVEVKDEPDLGITFFTKVYRYSTLVIAAVVNLDRNSAREGMEVILNHWNDHPRIKAMYPTKYRISLYNYAAQCIEAGRIEESARLIQEFETLPSLNFNQEAEKFQSLAYLKVILAIGSEKRAAVLSIVSMVKSGLDRFGDKVNKSREFAIKHNLAHLLVLDEHYKEALHWLRSIIAEKKYAIRKEIVNDARLLVLIVYWEMGEKELLSNEITAYYQYLYTNDFLNDYTKGMVSHLKRLMAAIDSYEELEVFKSLGNELSAQLKDRKYSALGIELILNWVKHKEMRLPIRKVAFISRSAPPED